MTYRGRVQNGQIKVEGGAVLPEGATVELTVVEQAAPRPNGRPIEEILDQIVAEVPDSEWDKLPPDLTDQLDYYVYGTPRS